MNIMVVGSGGREHVICWKLSQSKKVNKIYCIPGNAGIEDSAECVDIKVDDFDKIIEFSQKNHIDLAVIGPEAPLVEGLADILIEKDIKVFGPVKKGAKLEGSKIYSKEFMERYDIPTAKYKKFKDPLKAKKSLKEFKPPYVLKADGLAAGKGVLICSTELEGKQAVEKLMEDKKFGDAGKNIIIEEFLDGIEGSLLCLVSKNKLIPMESARDYKKAKDNDLGLNTGGMGCFSPNPLFTEELKKHIKKNITDKIEIGLKEEGIVFTGILFIGLMIKDNQAKVLEFNVRFGDPEAQVVLPRLDGDLSDILLKTISGEISLDNLKWKDEKAVAVILTSGGYPEKYEKGLEIKGLDTVGKDVTVFHSGTKKIDEKYYTDGGRVLAGN
ncbi:MAG TPA: phosphoribosylamine--glycine ligase, partial [Clostridiales bacterium]|nr:phosphoribosylamine--glycine ligase [Clostridiales bacterium]